MSSSSGGAALVETAHFRVLGACVEPRRWPDVDNDLTDVIVDELAPLGLIPDVCAFERLFTSIVEGSAPTPGLAWNSFYRNTLARLRRPADAQGRRSGSVAAFARIYAEVGRLTLGGSVLDVASCFGFLPILLAERLPGVVVGSDADKPTALLAGRVARALRQPGALPRRRRAPAAAARARGGNCDRRPPARAPAPIRRGAGARGGDPGRRPAGHRRRAVRGHAQPGVRARAHFRPRALAELGGATGWRYATWESDGGWLVLDRP